MRITLTASSSPQSVCTRWKREPTREHDVDLGPQAVRHRQRAPGRAAVTRPGRSAGDDRRAEFSARARTCALAPRAPPPTKISGRAEPLAGRRPLEASGSSSGGDRAGARMRRRPGFPPARPAGSRARPGAAGRGICPNASAIRRGASCGASMRAAHLVRRRMMPSWSGISCSTPKPRPIGAADLTGQAQHRRVAGVGGRQRRGGVEKAGPARRKTPAPRSPRRSRSHVAGRLLVARDDHPETLRRRRRAR